MPAFYGNRYFSGMQCSWLLWARMMLTVFLLFDSLHFWWLFIKDAVDDNHSATLDLMKHLARTAIAATLFLQLLQCRHGGQTYRSLHKSKSSLAYGVCVVSAINERETSVFAGAILYLWIAVLLIHSSPIFFNCARSADEPGNPNRLHEPLVSCLRRLSLWWSNSLPRMLANKNLTVDDMFRMAGGEFDSEALSALWDRRWKAAVEEYRTTSKRPSSESPSPSVIRVLFRIFKAELVSAGLIKGFSDILLLAQPFLLQKLINFVADPNALLCHGIFYAVSMFACSQVGSLTDNYQQRRMGVLALQVQSMLGGAVYQKSLHLSGTSRREYPVGEIINLMTGDVERLRDAISHLHECWSCPFQLIIVLAYLYAILGVAVYPALFVVVTLLPLGILSNLLTRHWHLQKVRLEDQRLTMWHQMLNGIKTVKLFAWEIPMLNAIGSVRRDELKVALKIGLVSASLDALNFSTVFLMSTLSFATYTLIDPEKNPLTPDVVAIAVTLFYQLRGLMKTSMMLARQAIDVTLSVMRLNRFLASSEVDIDDNEKKKDGKEPLAVSVMKASFYWKGRCVQRANFPSPGPTIRNLTFEVPRSALVAITGLVGSGKSSLLSALLGEMNKLSGSTLIRGSVAYAGQQAWIQNATLRDNVTFGAPFAEDFYNTVIEACCLEEDLEFLPKGDATVIGERGANLSGGQKARVALARAAYQDCDVYLLDDPLSAVDCRVGRHIIEKLIGPRGLLRDKTRIVVTHNSSVIRHAHEVLLVEGGEIIASGRYRELITSNQSFQQFISGEDSSKSSVPSFAKKKQVQYVPGVTRLADRFQAKPLMKRCLSFLDTDTDVPTINTLLLADELNLVELRASPTVRMLFGPE